MTYPLSKKNPAFVNYFFFYRQVFSSPLQKDGEGTLSILAFLQKTTPVIRKNAHLSPSSAAHPHCS